MDELEPGELDLADQLRRLASHADTRQSEVLARAAIGRRRPSPLLGLGLGVAVAGAVVAGTVALGSGPSPDGPSSTSQRTPVKNAKPGDEVTFEYSRPCPGAHQVTLDEVQREATIPVTESSPTSLKFAGAYFCLGGPAEPALAYGDVYLTFETGWAKVPLDKGWAERIQREGGRPYITTFNGDPALVDPADPKDPNVVPEILVVRGDYLIRIQGERGAEIEPLIDVASHLDKTPDLPTPTTQPAG